MAVSRIPLYFMLFSLVCIDLATSVTSQATLLDEMWISVGSDGAATNSANGELEEEGSGEVLHSLDFVSPALTTSPAPPEISVSTSPTMSEVELTSSVVAFTNGLLSDPGGPSDTPNTGEIQAFSASPHIVSSTPVVHPSSSVQIATSTQDLTSSAAQIISSVSESTHSLYVQVASSKHEQTPSASDQVISSTPELTLPTFALIRSSKLGPTPSASTQIISSRSEQNSFASAQTATSNSRPAPHASTQMASSTPELSFSVSAQITTSPPTLTPSVPTHIISSASKLSRFSELTASVSAQITTSTLGLFSSDSAQTITSTPELIHFASNQIISSTPTTTSSVPVQITSRPKLTSFASSQIVVIPELTPPVSAHIMSSTPELPCDVNHLIDSSMHHTVLPSSVKCVSHPFELQRGSISPNSTHMHHLVTTELGDFTSQGQMQRPSLISLETSTKITLPLSDPLTPTLQTLSPSLSSSHTSQVETNKLQTNIISESPPHRTSLGLPSASADLLLPSSSASLINQVTPIYGATSLYSELLISHAIFVHQLSSVSSELLTSQATPREILSSETSELLTSQVTPMEMFSSGSSKLLTPQVTPMKMVISASSELLAFQVTSADAPYSALSEHLISKRSSVDVLSSLSSDLLLQTSSLGSPAVKPTHVSSLSPVALSSQIYSLNSTEKFVTYVETPLPSKTDSQALISSFTLTQMAYVTENMATRSLNPPGLTWSEYDRLTSLQEDATTAIFATEIMQQQNSSMFRPGSVPESDLLVNATVSAPRISPTRTELSQHLSLPATIVSSMEDMSLSPSLETISVSTWSDEITLVASPSIEVRENTFTPADIQTLGVPDDATNLTMSTTFDSPNFLMSSLTVTEHLSFSGLSQSFGTQTPSSLYNATVPVFSTEHEVPKETSQFMIISTNTKEQGISSDYSLYGFPSETPYSEELIKFSLHHSLYSSFVTDTIANLTDYKLSTISAPPSLFPSQLTSHESSISQLETTEWKLSSSSFLPLSGTVDSSSMSGQTLLESEITVSFSPATTEVSGDESYTSSVKALQNFSTFGSSMQTLELSSINPYTELSTKSVILRESESSDVPHFISSYDFQVSKSVSLQMNATGDISVGYSTAEEDSTSLPNTALESRYMASSSLADYLTHSVSKSGLFSMRTVHFPSSASETPFVAPTRTVNNNISAAASATPSQASDRRLTSLYESTSTATLLTGTSFVDATVDISSLSVGFTPSLVTTASTTKATTTTTKTTTATTIPATTITSTSLRTSAFIATATFMVTTPTTARAEITRSTQALSSSATTSIPVVSALRDVTLMLSFTVKGECSTLRQAPYGMHFKTTLARTLLYLTRLHEPSGVKIRIGDPRCKTEPHLISVSFLRVDRHAVLQTLNSTHSFYGVHGYQTFSPPIEVKFSAESRKFVVDITGFEEVEGFDERNTNAAVFGADTAVIATAACLCVILLILGCAIFTREMYLKRRADCCSISGKPSPTFRMDAFTLAQTSGMYKGGKKGIDNPALCSSVYNDLEMTEVHLGDTEDEDDSSYYNPYDVEYSSIGSTLNAAFDTAHDVGYIPDMCTTIVVDVSPTSEAGDIERKINVSNGQSPSRKADVHTKTKRKLSSSGNYGLVIGLLGYNKQQQASNGEGTLSLSQQDYCPPSHLHGTKKSYDNKGYTEDVGETAYAVPVKLPRRPRKASRKRPALNLSPDPTLPLDLALSWQPESGDNRPSPLPPPRRSKHRVDRGDLGQELATIGGRQQFIGEGHVSSKGESSETGDGAHTTGHVNQSFLGDEGYAAISSSTQSFRF